MAVIASRTRRDHHAGTSVEATYMIYIRPVAGPYTAQSLLARSAAVRQHRALACVEWNASNAGRHASVVASKCYYVDAINARHAAGYWRWCQS